MSFSATLTEKRDAALVKAETIVSAAQAEARELTTEEDADITSALADVRSLDEQIEKHSELEKRSAEAAELRKEKKFDVAVGGTVVCCSQLRSRSIWYHSKKRGKRPSIIKFCSFVYKELFSKYSKQQTTFL